MKNIIQNINIIIIVILILLSTLLIGTPSYESNVQIVYILTSIFSICYFIIFKLIKKEKIITSKIDICIIVLVFSTLIPLIAKTYVSLSETIHIILKYFTVLNLYLITKSECRKNPKYIDIVLNTIIISILLLCIIGIDEINGNYLKDFKELVNYNYIQDEEIRIGSLFSYPNAMAVIAGAGFFLCLGYIFKKQDNSKVKKVLYIIIALIMLITLILTYSRLVYILFALSIIIYGLILCKNYNVKINKKTITGLFIITLLVVLYIVIGLQVPSKVSINKQYQKIMYSVLPDEDYCFKFDIEATSTEEDGFLIEITEKDKYFDDVNITKIDFGSFSGEKEIKIHTQENTSVMYINIESKKESQSLLINNSYLNGEKFILKYKLLPTGIVEKVQSISFSNKSAWERLNFIKDALKIIKDNWLCGLGGNAWRTMQLKVQQYSYYASEVHCFIIQIFLENGIAGFLSCIGIIIFILIHLFKEIKNKEMNIQNISLAVAIMFILMHSLLDFDMSFFYILLIVFLMISVLKKDKSEIKKETKKSKIVNYLLYIVLIIISIANIYTTTIEMYYKNDQIISKKGAIWTQQERFSTYYEILPFNKNIKIDKYGILINSWKQDNAELQGLIENILTTEKYTNSNLQLQTVYIYVESILKDYIEIYSEENNTKVDVDKLEKLDFALEYIKETEQFSKYRPDFQIIRLRNLKQIIKILQEAEITEYANKFEEQLEKEILEKEECILDYSNARYKKENVEKYKNSIEGIKK